MVVALAVCGIAAACSSTDATEDGGAASTADCATAWNIVEQIRMQRQLADDDFSDVQATLEESLAEVDSTAVSTALREINDNVKVYAGDPTPTEGSTARLHIDHAIASLGLACVESSPDLQF